MKKILLSVIALTAMSSNAQLILSEDFNNLNIGDLSSDVSGTLPGQGDWFIWGSAGAGMTASSAQIVDAGATQGLALQMTGPAGATGAYYAWKDGFTTAYAAREVGNDVVQVEFDLFTGGATTSKNAARVMLLSSTGITLAGISFALDTKIVSGLGYYDGPSGVTTYIFGLGESAAQPVVLPANTWVRMGFSFDPANGEIFWLAPGVAEGTYVPGAGAGMIVAEVDLAMAGTAGNTLAGTSQFDNLEIMAVAEQDLSTEAPVFAGLSEIKIYPNPASSVISIGNGVSAIKSISIVDMNGRKIKSVDAMDQTVVDVNISDLPSGIYFVSITSETGISTKKLVKN